MAAANVQPLTSAQIANQIAGYTAGMPKPLTAQQIQQQAQAQLSPMVAALTAKIQGGANAGSAATLGYGDKLASNLANYGASTQKIYGDAQQAQAAADAAESGGLRATGADLANGLSAKLAQIGGPANAASETLGGLTGATSGAANATMGLGSASLAQLIGEGAHAQEYGSKLPALAQMQALGDSRDIQLAAGKNLSDQVGQVQSQLPSLVASLQSRSDANAANRASARNQGAQYVTSRQDDINKFLKAEQDAGLNVKVKANAAVQTAKIKASTAAAKDAKPNSALSKSMGYVVDSSGNMIANKDGSAHVLPGFAVKNGQVVKTATGKAVSAKTLTPGEVANLKKAAVKQADLYYYGQAPKQHYDASSKAYSDVPGTGVPGLNYGDAIRRIMAQFSLGQKDAQEIVNNYYAPGERGRPAHGDVNPRTNPRAAGPIAPKL